MLRFHDSALIPGRRPMVPTRRPAQDQFPGPPVPEQSFFRSAAQMPDREWQRPEYGPALDALPPRHPKQRAVSMVSILQAGILNQSADFGQRGSATASSNLVAE